MSLKKIKKWLWDDAVYPKDLMGTQILTILTILGILGTFIAAKISTSIVSDEEKVESVQPSNH